MKTDILIKKNKHRQIFFRLFHCKINKYINFEFSELCDTFNMSEDSPEDEKNSNPYLKMSFSYPYLISLFTFFICAFHGIFSI